MNHVLGRHSVHSLLSYHDHATHSLLSCHDRDTCIDYSRHAHVINIPKYYPVSKQRPVYNQTLRIHRPETYKKPTSSKKIKVLQKQKHIDTCRNLRANNACRGPQPHRNPYTQPANGTIKVRGKPTTHKGSVHGAGGRAQTHPLPPRKLKKIKSENLENASNRCLRPLNLGNRSPRAR